MVAAEPADRADGAPLRICWSGAHQPGKALPLYDQRGVPETEGGNVLCGSCHDPHNWSPLAKGSPAGDPRQPVGRQRIEKAVGVLHNLHLLQRHHPLPCFDGSGACDQ